MVRIQCLTYSKQWISVAIIHHHRHDFYHNIYFQVILVHIYHAYTHIHTCVLVYIYTYIHTALEEGHDQLLCIWFPLSLNSFSHHCHALMEVLMYSELPCEHVNISDSPIIPSILQAHDTGITWELVKQGLQATCNVRAFISPKECMESMESALSSINTLWINNNPSHTLM